MRVVETGQNPFSESQQDAAETTKLSDHAYRTLTIFFSAYSQRGSNREIIQATNKIISDREYCLRELGTAFESPHQNISDREDRLREIGTAFEALFHPSSEHQRSGILPVRNRHGV